jgi:phage major head subunit gpT-like protein
MMTSNTFGSLIAPGQEKIFFDTYMGVEPEYTKVFTVLESNKAIEKVNRVSGFTPWKANTEGAAFDTEETAITETVTFTPVRYDKSYTISWELMQDDESGVFAGRAGAGGSAEALGMSLRATVEQTCADVLNNGFESESPLFSDENANIATGALSADSIKEAIKTLRAQKDGSGEVLIGAKPSKLIVHPDNEFVARQLLYSEKAPGGMNNDINPLPRLELVVMDYLTNEDAWFIQAKDIQNLTMFWREKPIFGAQNISGTMDYRFYGYTRFSVGSVDHRGLVGSNGIAL